MRLNTSSSHKICFSHELVTFLIGATALFTSGCAGRLAHPDTSDTADQFKPAQPAVVGQPLPVEQTGAPTPVANGRPQQDPRMSAAGLNARLDEVEAKMASMNEKLDATRASIDGFLTTHQAKAAGVSNFPTENSGTPINDVSETGPGFIQNGAIHLFRKANILFESQKYSEANLAYMSFLEKYPDHPLAGSAQFHVGEGYFKQKEYKQAAEEFKKVLTSYDRSSVVAITLRELAESEDSLGKAQEAARYRQQLLSLFPSSPAAQNVAQVSSSEDNRTAGAVAVPQSKSFPETQAVPREEVAPTQQTGASTNAPSRRDLDQPPPTAPMSEKQGPGETTPQ